MYRLFAITLIVSTLCTPLFASEKQVLKEVARKYKATPQEVALLKAIRRFENGRPGFQLGVEHPKAKGLQKQYEWALWETRQASRRWYAMEEKPCYLWVLASDYCPGNRVNWYNGVKTLYIKYTKGGA